jgi:hypothetical protein
MDLRSVGVLDISFWQRYVAHSNLIVLDSGVDHIVVYLSSRGKLLGKRAWLCRDF